jgi:3-deoxy-manno-octulosonate cytidylyltransferase (CMP-KDO synthetase)
MSAVGIIPARFGSSRLEGKVIKAVGEKPLIQLVYEAARTARRLDDIIVATDDRLVADIVSGFGARAVLTSPAHRSGSDRLAEVAATIDCTIVVNIQGDEPMIRGEMIDATVGILLNEPELEVATLATVIREPKDARDPNVVKVVRDIHGNALYFSRAPVPYVRNGTERGGRFLKHIGLYAYRKSLLMRFTKWPQTELEKLEKLEQLRILEHGVKIRVLDTPHDPIGVDTAEDLERVRKLLASD